MYAAGVHFLVLDCARCSANLVPKLGMLALVIWVGCAAWPTLIQATSKSAMARAARTAGIGLAIGTLLLLIELVFDAPIHRLTDAVPPNDVVDSARYNRIITAFVLLAWPVAALLGRVGHPRLGVVLIAATMLAAGLGASAAALVMVVVSVAAFVLPRWAPDGLPRIAVGALITIVILAPMIFALTLPASAPVYDRLPPSFADRLEIWDHTSRTVRRGPWYGHGITAQRTLPIQDGGTAYRYHREPATHAHNMALQWWLEFGVVGPVGLIGLVMLAFQGLNRLDRETRPYAAAAAAAAAAVSLVGYGFWQETWLGMIGMTVIAIRLSAASGATHAES